MQDRAVRLSQQLIEAWHVAAAALANWALQPNTTRLQTPPSSRLGCMKGMGTPGPRWDGTHSRGGPAYHLDTHLIPQGNESKDARWWSLALANSPSPQARYRKPYEGCRQDSVVANNNPSNLDEGYRIGYRMAR